MSPDGTRLLVSGQGSVQILPWNGAGPATLSTGLLTTDAVDQVFWDNRGHLDAVSRAAGKLHVFTVRATGDVEAPRNCPTQSREPVA